LTSYERNKYEEDGIIFLKSFLKEDARELLQNAALGYAQNPTFQGELVKYVGPPPFELGIIMPWPSFVTDTSFRELMVRIPSGHVSHQLNKKDDQILIDPTLLGGKNLQARWHVDYIAMPHEDRAKMENCGDYMVFWMPAHDCGEDCPGMQFLKGSHKYIQQRDIKWVQDLIFKGAKAKRDMLANGHGELFVPEFKVGDAVVFNQCILHSTKPTENDVSRVAYQVRVGPKPDMSKIPEQMKPWPGVLQGDKTLISVDVWPSFPEKAPLEQEQRFETITSKFEIFNAWIRMPIWVTGSAVKMRFGSKLAMPIFVISMAARSLFGFFI